MQSEMAACAHLNVLYVRINNQNGTCSDSWQCRDCKTLFKPFIPTPPAPIAAQTEKTAQELAKGYVEEMAENLKRNVAKDKAARAQTAPEQVDAARLSAAEFLWGGYDWDKSGRGYICKHTGKLMLISDVMEAYRSASLKQETPLDYWRCFHCDFATTNRAEAEAHFGDRDDAEEFKPICKWWQLMSEDERIATLQDTIQQLNDERAASLKQETQPPTTLPIKEGIYIDVDD